MEAGVGSSVGSRVRASETDATAWSGVGCRSRLETLTKSTSKMTGTRGNIVQRGLKGVFSIRSTSTEILQASRFCSTRGTVKGRSLIGAGISENLVVFTEGIGGRSQ